MNVKNVSVNIYMTTTNEEDVKRKIEEAVQDMHRKNIGAVMRELSLTAKPDTITLEVAAEKYGKEFLEKKYHRNLSDASFEKYLRDIRKHYGNLPQMEPNKFKGSFVTEYYKNNVVGQHTKKLLWMFYEYLLEEGLIQSKVNPFPEVVWKKKPTAEANQERVSRLKELSLEQQDVLFEKLVKEPTGGDCGIALVTWGGFNANDKIIWKDITFKCDYTCVHYRKENSAGATHDYTRTLFSQADIILRKRYAALVEKYGDVGDCPVISLEKDIHREMESAAFHQYAAMRLKQIGITEKTFAKNDHPGEAVSKRILRMTYEKNVENRIGLDKDEGTKRYLLGLSLSGNVTDDNYTSFNDQDANERISTAQRAIQPLVSYGEKRSVTQVEGDKETRVFLPDTSRNRAGVVAEIILPPHAWIETDAKHGPTGRIKAREIMPDGKLKRKTKTSGHEDTTQKVVPGK